MKKRIATDSIKGYFYQFDYTILKILQLKNSSDLVTIEGVEDIDITSANEESAIQCKYYSKTTYNHSAIAEPIRLMLNHFKSFKDGKASKINYFLRGHYKGGQNKLILPIDTNLLKEKFLTYTRTINKKKVTFQHHQDLNLSDKDLEEFLMVLVIDVNATDFDNQFKEVLRLLKVQFGCQDFSAENFFYNNALRVIRELSIQEDKNDRTISKHNFLKSINNSQILFNEWFLKRKGEKQHFVNLRKEFFTNLNVSPFERFFIFEIDLTSYRRSEIKEILLTISRKWSKISKRDPKPFCPYVYLHNIDSIELKNIKKELSTEDHNFSDGFDFNGADFNANSIIKRPNFSNQIKLKIIDNLSYINQIISVTKGTKQIYQFYLKDPFYINEVASIKHIKIQINKVDNIINII